MATKEPKVVLYYVPPTPGAGWSDIPKRDLTERDLARLSGFQLANATAPGPNGAPPIYQKTAPSGKRAKDAEDAKAKAAAPATTPKE